MNYFRLLFAITVAIKQASTFNNNHLKNSKAHKLNIYCKLSAMTQLNRTSKMFGELQQTFKNDLTCKLCTSHILQEEKTPSQ